jgi:chromosome segregation ATPase
MKAKILAWLKANVKYLILFVVLVFIVSLLGIKQCKVVRLTKKINTLEVLNLSLKQDRVKLDYQLEELNVRYEGIRFTNDSLKSALNTKQKELKALIAKHAAELADLTNIPPDTVYLRLQTLYPNYDATDLRFPFSATQIKPIYATAISLDMVKAEYTLQGKSLESCLNLNTGYEKGILNLNTQISTLNENIGKADLQIKNYDKEVLVLKRQITKKGFWTKVFMISTGVAVGVAILK